MENIRIDGKVHEECRKAWEYMHNQNALIQKIHLCLGYLSNDELEDVIEYLTIVLRKKGKRGDFDWYRDYIKRTRGET